MKRKINVDSKVQVICSRIKVVLEAARNNAYRAVNFAMVKAYWQVGKIIVEEEQRGRKRAGYGKYLLRSISQQLSSEYGKGFDESNLRNMRSFYGAFPKCDALRHELTWTHYRLLLRMRKKKARGFYAAETIDNNWSTRELKRQINSLLFERISLSRDKKEILNLARNGQTVFNAKDMIKDPYVLEFLDLEEKKSYLEKDLEQALIDKLQAFLLELGKGFSFVARQQRISTDSQHFYIDLVFYNYILKCFVLVDLKIGELTPQDIGQMDRYVRIYEDKVKPKDCNPTVGVILCSEKDEAIVKYSILKESRRLFASRYKLYLPTEEELKGELSKERELLELE